MTEDEKLEDLFERSRQCLAENEKFREELKKIDMSKQLKELGIGEDD